MRERALESHYNDFIVNTTEVARTSLPQEKEALQVSELCERLKALGYAESKHIRIYGDEFEVISNPFPQGNGIAVCVRSEREKQSRVLPLPLPVLQVATRKSA